MNTIKHPTSLCSTCPTPDIGIAPEEQEQIFQQYYQVDSPRQRKLKGTGLGLPLSRKLAELLGGSIRLRSQVGVGSHFSVRIAVDTILQPAEIHYSLDVRRGREAAASVFRESFSSMTRMLLAI